jgi:acetyl-CoA carboxylase carboxyltransferase component
VDYGDFFEVQAGFAPNIVWASAACKAGRVGIIANQP